MKKKKVRRGAKGYATNMKGLRPATPSVPRVTCKDCGATYDEGRPHAMFCPAHTCDNCGSSYSYSLPVYDSRTDPPTRWCDRCLEEECNAENENMEASVDKQSEIMKTLIRLGVREQVEFGYTGCTADNIITDKVYAKFFESTLNDALEDAEADKESEIAGACRALLKSIKKGA